MYWVTIAATMLAMQIVHAGTVHELSDENFETLVKHYDYLLVAYQSPTCHHCKGLVPELEGASTVLNEDDTAPSFGVTTVDCVRYDKLCINHQIDQYPTIRLIHGEQVFTYKGARSSSAIVTWVRRRIGASFEVDSQSEIDQFVKNSPVVILYCGPTSTPDFELYDHVATLFETLIFLHTESSSIKYPTAVVLFAHHIERVLPFQGQLTEQGLIAFVEMNRYPRVMEFSLDTANYVFGSMRSTLFLFIGQEHREARAEFVKLGALYDSERLPLVVVDISKDAAIRLANLIGLAPGDLPAIRMITSTGSTAQDLKTYSYEETSILVPKLTAFIGKFFDGKLHPSLKSQDEGPNDIQNGVRILVANNYEHVVQDVTRDVLVLHTAPWCVHSKNMIPVIEEIAQLTRKQTIGSTKLVVARIDATLNDIPDLKISKFPTLILYRAQNKAKVEYDGDRTQEGILKWLKQQTTQQVPSKNEL